MSVSSPQPHTAGPAQELDGWRILPFKLDDSGQYYATLRDGCNLSEPAALDLFSKIATRVDRSKLIGLKVRAAALLLRDLLKMGWDIRGDRHWILARPGTHRHGSTKRLGNSSSR
jgi:hypothetical protein